MDAKEKADLQLSVLEDLADTWADEVDLSAMVRAVASPMGLNRSVPNYVRQEFRERMKEQMRAIAIQSFIEGAYRGITMMQEIFKERQ